jgi:FkbM family methyltransferase
MSAEPANRNGVFRTGHGLFRRFGRLTTRIVSPWLKQAKAMLGVHTEYPMGRFTVRLPAQHFLPDYQKLHAHYDKFLPHLVRFVDSGSTVIDVGANCGDTVAAMLQANATLNYICVEPDDRFFGYLDLNVRRMRAEQPGASILLHKALIGKAVSVAGLEGNFGTSHAVAVREGDTQETISSITLDSMRFLPHMDKVSVLKSDVDGFDYDVIDSAEALIAEQLPILFFECQFTDLDQKTAYQNTITRLEKSGYREWTVFDNYGEVVLHGVDSHTLFQLFDYVWRQNAELATRTIVYFDVMASTAERKTLVDGAVSAYVR